ncbi:MAG: hypothetical protein EA401_04555 [Planctomycetota bacterium]|nr:MAG: hypothetical protein EA401_04555 [Planctomycetota bacterium]
MARSRLTNPSFALHAQALELVPGPTITHTDFDLSMRGERDYVLRMATDTGMRRWTISCKTNERYLELGLILAMIRLHGFDTAWKVQQRITWGLRRMHAITGIISLSVLIGGERLIGSSGLISAIAYSMALPSIISGVGSWLAGRRILVWTKALSDPQAIINQRQWLLVPHAINGKDAPPLNDAADSRDDEERSNPFARATAAYSRGE